MPNVDSCVVTETACLVFASSRCLVLIHIPGEQKKSPLRISWTALARTRLATKKIEFCRKQAARDKIQYFWVDTCCIDKANHAELSEAITSMFRWYRDAVKCYVYLSDVSTSTRDNTGQTEQAWQSTFRISRWFTRGWTLQELLAPRYVEFFSREGKLLGDKQTLEGLVHEITDIPIAALQGTPLTEFPIDQRLL
jgi:hypothetical protein